MTINWAALGVVAAVSLAVGVLVVVLVSLALVGLSAREQGGDPPEGTHVPSAAVGTVTAAACLSVAAVIVLYGLSILVF